MWSFPHQISFILVTYKLNSLNLPTILGRVYITSIKKGLLTVLRPIEEIDNANLYHKKIVFIFNLVIDIIIDKCKYCLFFTQ